MDQADRENLEGAFGYPDAPETIEDVIARANAIELRLMNMEDRINAYFGVALLLLFAIAYKVFFG